MSKQRHQSAPPKAEGQWRRPKLLGYTETLRGLGGIVAPLLTGFSLATIAVLLTATTHPWLWRWAIVALTVAVAVFLFAMQVSFLALARSPSPSDFLAWVPEIADDEALRAKARTEQAHTFEQMSRLWRRAGFTYEIAIIAFLAGVVLLLVPHKWTLVKGLPAGVSGLALGVELWWTAANKFARLPHPALGRREGTPAAAAAESPTAAAVAAPESPTAAAVAAPERPTGSG
jgi:MFS family permease